MLSFKMSAMPIAEQASSTALDLAWVRSQFPALAQTIKGHPAVFLDGPGGTQVPQQVIDAIADYLSHNNAAAAAVAIVLLIAVVPVLIFNLRQFRAVEARR